MTFRAKLYFSLILTAFVSAVLSCGPAPSTPKPKATKTPTITLTPTDTPTVTLTPTITLSPTLTLTPTVTATPTACGSQGTMGDQAGSSGYVGQYSTTVYLSQFTLSSTSSSPVLKDIQAKLYTASQTLNYEVGIYDQIAGKPGNLLGQSGVTAVNNGSGIPSTPFGIPGNVTLTNGATYYLAVVYFNDVGVGPGVAFDSGASNQHFFYLSPSASSLPASYTGGTITPNPGTFAIYADFCQ